MALTKISGEVVGSSITIGIVTANTINVGSAVTIHTRGFQVGTSDLHSTGLNLGSGNIISHNINSTGTISASSINVSGIITATQFVTGTSGSAIGINTNTISGPETITIDPAAIGDNTGLVVIKGDLQIDGTTTTINSTTLTVDDKNIVLGSGAANDAAADGSGITIESGNGNKTFQFEDTGDNLGSSENLNVASGKVYKVNNTSVLSSTTLGSGVVNSSLTSVGTLTNLNVGNVNSSGIVTATTFVGALTGNAATVTTNANLTGDVTSTGNATAIAAGVIVNADINASAGIVDTKLATISTAGKVSNSATTATNANTGSAIVARDASGNFSAGTITATLSGNSTTATNLSTSGGNWSTNGTISAVVGQLAWKNYGNSHTIFDASNGTSPAGGAVNNTNSGVAWVATYPTLMGWNGSNTYGVRVDSARISDSTSGSSASVANAATFNSGGAGAVSGTTFNGSAAQTISYNTIGASPLAGSSSLVTTGTVTSGTWSGSFGAVSGANLTSLTAGNLSGTIPSGVLGNSTHYVGTTAILLNRASASQSLTGINIDGSSGSVTGLTLNSSVSPINPDNVTQNQLGYDNSVSLFGHIDGGLYSSAYNSSWIHQIHGDFRTGQIAIRGKNSGTWQAWRTVLDSSNYTSYSPTLTGTGASGSWGINVTGSSASCTGNSATATTATNQSGGTVSATTGSFSSTLTVGGAIVRSAAGVGYLSGNYSSSESPSTSGAIYTIGGAYVPTSTTLGNMYGIGYGYAGNGGIGNPGGVGSSTWGMYVATNGTARIFLDSDNGISYATGSHRSPIFYDSGNTAYYTDPASTSNLNGLTVAATITGSISGNAATVTTNANLTGDVTSTGNATSIAAGVIVNADINASAGIVDTKLATIATAGKVSNSATTATSANTASAIVARDASGNFSAGWINTISGDLGVGSRLDRVYTSNDGYIRYLGLTDFKNQMGLSSKNTYSRRVDFTADANYWVGSFGHSGYGANETFHGGSGFFDIWGGTNYPSGLSHIHGINMLHYTANSFGTTDGLAYGWQMVAQYDTNSGPWWRRCSGGTFSSWLRLVSYGNNQSGDIYAERYYDHNNTAYYVDPASTSNLNGLTVNSTFTVNNGWSYVANNYGYGIVGLYYASIFQLVFAMGDSYKTTAAGGINNLYGIAWSHPNAGGIAGNLNTHGALITENGAFLAALSGSIRCRDDMRAPLYYDSGNTAYYTDPASTSNLNSLTLNGSLTVGSGASSDIYMIDTDEGTRRIHCNSNRIGFLNQDAGWGSYCSDNGDWTTDTISYAGASFRAPIFYDSGNTAYYIDPASTTTSVQVAGAIEQGNNYAHPNIEWSATSATGEVIFYLPGTTSNYGMVHMVFDIYEYNSPRLCTVIVGGHNWSTQWHNTGCNVVGFTDKSVRLGVKGGRFCVVFGSTGSGWSYGTIRLRKIHNGGFYDNTMDLGGNWSTELTTSESFSYISGDLRGLRTPSTFEADGIIYGYTDVRSPIFYDSGNTAYYTDPASTSNLNALQVVTFGVGTAASGTAGEIRATNNITAYYSDERLKENIKPISSALSKLLTLRGVTFNSNEIAEQYGYTDKKEQVGVIAQDVEKILPQIVVPAPFDIAQDEDGNEYSKSGENYKTVHYDKLVPLLIEAIKEQQIQINYLKNIIINKSSN